MTVSAHLGGLGNTVKTGSTANRIPARTVEPAYPSVEATSASVTDTKGKTAMNLTHASLTHANMEASVPMWTGQPAANAQIPDTPETSVKWTSVPIVTATRTV